MCPNKKTLSAFFDNEIDSSRRVEIENHLNTCSQCRHQLETWATFSNSFMKTQMAPMLGQKEALWVQIEAKCLHFIKKTTLPMRIYNFFHERISFKIGWAIPITVAVVTFFAIFSAFFVDDLFNERYENRSDSQYMAQSTFSNSPTDTPQVIPSVEEQTARQRSSVSTVTYGIQPLSPVSSRPSNGNIFRAGQFQHFSDFDFFYNNFFFSEDTTDSEKH